MKHATWEICAWCLVTAVVATLIASADWRSPAVSNLSSQQYGTLVVLDARYSTGNEYEWRLDSSDGVYSLEPVDGMLVFSAPPGTYTVHLTVRNGRTFDKVFRAITIDPPQH